MVFSGLEPLAGLLAQSLASEAGRTAHPAAQWVLSRRTTRARRRVAYQRLQVVLLRARLRIDMLLKIHATRIHPVGVIPAITGYSTVAAALDRVVVDLSETMDAWLVVEDLAPPRVRASARRAVLALAGLMSHHDPTWYQLPGRRSAQRAADHARLEYAQHIRELDRLTQADAAPRARDRRDARRQRGGWASPS